MILVLQLSLVFFERRLCQKIEIAIARNTKSGLNTPFIF